MRKITSCIIYIVNFLSSLTFTVIVLIGLIFTAFINIFDFKILKITERLLPKSAATIKNIFEFFGLSDLNHSWWFKTLLILFSINLLVCTLKRIPQTWRSILPFKVNPDAPFSFDFSVKETFTLSDLSSDFEDRLKKFFSRKWHKPLVLQKNGESIFFSQKEK